MRWAEHIQHICLGFLSFKMWYWPQELIILVVCCSSLVAYCWWAINNLVLKQKFKIKHFNFSSIFKSELFTSLSAWIWIIWLFYLTSGFLIALRRKSAVADQGCGCLGQLRNCILFILLDLLTWRLLRTTLSPHEWEARLELTNYFLKMDPYQRLNLKWECMYK